MDLESVDAEQTWSVTSDLDTPAHQIAIMAAGCVAVMGAWNIFKYPYQTKLEHRVT